MRCSIPRAIPIAYVHEGMHVRANKAYLEMFGYDEFEDIEGMSILDMIAADDADDFKTLLKKLSKGEKPPQKLNLKAQRADGSTFDAVMEFAEANYEGEPCQQISFRQQTESAELAKELDALRSKDLVTDLFNRQYGLGELDRMIGEAAKGKQRSDSAAGRAGQFQAPARHRRPRQCRPAAGRHGRV